jgi:hypothetical protein
MTPQDPIESLRAEHKSLELAIDQEVHRAIPDTDRIADLKKQKLRIKDRIAQLEH